MSDPQGRVVVLDLDLDDTLIECVPFGLMTTHNTVYRNCALIEFESEASSLDVNIGPCCDCPRPIQGTTQDVDWAFVGLQDLVRISGTV